MPKVPGATERWAEEMGRREGQEAALVIDMSVEHASRELDDEDSTGTKSTRHS